MRKPVPPASRIVAVATNIDKTQRRRTEIAKRVTVLEAELEKLDSEESALATVQAELARQMDKLTAGPNLGA